MKKLFALLSVFVLVSMLLAACGSPAPVATEAPAAEAPAAEAPAATEAPAEAPAAEQVTITIASWR